MCGIIGAAGNLNATSDKIIKQLLIVDSLRGEDSTGAAFIRRSGDVFVAKEVGNSFALLENQRFKNNMASVNKVIIGHNRFATVGRVNKASAHPFEFESLVGVHNGTLENKYKLADSGDFSVDSENLYHHIDKFGLRDAINTCIGAWALVWWDKRNNTINFLRNKERTLYVAISQNKERLYWASERWMLTSICGRNGEKIEEPLLLEEDLHFEFEIKGTGEITKPVAKVVKGAERPLVSNYFMGHGGGTHTTNVANVGRTTPALSVVGSNFDKNKQPDGRYLSLKNIRFQSLGIDVDKFNNTYIGLFDSLNNTYEIRLYVDKCKIQPEQYDCDIIGDIQAYSIEDKCGYYKVNPSNARAVVGTGKPLVEEVEDDDIPLGTAGFFKNHKGVYINKDTWEAQYGNCSFCSVSINAEEEGYRMTTGGEILCGGCATNMDVASMVNLI